MPALRQVVPLHDVVHCQAGDERSEGDENGSGAQDHVAEHGGSPHRVGRLVGEYNPIAYPRQMVNGCDQMVGSSVGVGPGVTGPGVRVSDGVYDGVSVPVGVAEGFDKFEHLVLFHDNLLLSK